ncbi:MAG TPA: PD-(D/E)XK nuclease-like domain-containing protein [Aeromicrobium sp.]|nr:PD-(D/E)XK nuclease-like domain-containing protein [Aeromicrobium sp.]HKY57623.1 PD-(D/E)XK nuclease-like domain-containing protein [Aeromicrobium sp.]
MHDGLIENMSNTDYHAQTDWLSSSVLKKNLPEHYKTGGSQEALDFGTLFHTVVLEPELVAGYVALDAEKIGVKADGTPAQNPTMTAAWKKAVAEVVADGKQVVAQQDLDKAFAMRDAVKAHETAARLLFEEDGRNELSAFATDDAGTLHRARFDRIISGAIIDLKSTSGKPGADSITRSVIDYGYDLSAAHYLEVARMLGLDVQAFALVFVQKEEPYRVTVCDLDERFLERGRALRHLAIQRHLGLAPAYEGESGFLTLSAPEWAIRKVA